MNTWTNLPTNVKLQAFIDAKAAGQTDREMARANGYPENAVSSWKTRNKALVASALGLPVSPKRTSPGAPVATPVVATPVSTARVCGICGLTACEHLGYDDDTATVPSAPVVEPVEDAKPPVKAANPVVVDATSAGDLPASPLFDIPSLPDWALIKYIPAKARNIKLKGYAISPKLKGQVAVAILSGQDICIFGAPGNGKTYLGRVLSDELGMKSIETAGDGDLSFYIVNGGQIQDVDSLFQGTLELVNATAKRVLNQFIRAIQRPGIVVIDEFNRMPQIAQNYMLSLIEPGSRELQKADGTTIPVRCTFIFTANKGQAGTMPLVPALMDRLGSGIFQWDYPTVSQEIKLLEKSGYSADIAGSLVRVAHKQRKQWESSGFTLPMSTRMLVNLKSQYEVCMLMGNEDDFKAYVKSLPVFASEDASRWDAIVIQEWEETTATISDDANGSVDNEEPAF